MNAADYPTTHCMQPIQTFKSYICKRVCIYTYTYTHTHTQTHYLHAKSKKNNNNNKQ